MKQVAVRVSRNSQEYNLFIGAGVAQKLCSLVPLEHYSKILAFVDSGVEKKARSLLSSQTPSAIVKVVEGGESQKKLDEVEKLWMTCLEAEIDRHSLIINIGGGALCDVGAFVASTYMRGVATLQVPTTLLAQVDASIGGKTGFNLHNKKNFIGTFHQPVGVIIDTDFLETLPEREVYSGMSEIIKHGIIASPELLDMLSGLDTDWQNVTHIRKGNLTSIIELSCHIKAGIVAADEQERSGIRKLLNFGHTFGHAFESLSHRIGAPLLHGEAVAIGMVAESALALLCGMISEEHFEFIVSLIEKLGLPSRLPFNPEYAEIDELIQADKKNKGGVPHWTLPTSLGSASSDCIADKEAIKAALSKVLA